MAIFKMLHGDESNISLAVTPFHEGWVYITSEGYYYVDLNLGTAESPNNQRIKLNAGKADTATIAIKATQDASGNSITATYETKTSASAKLSEAKNYADNAVAIVSADISKKADKTTTLAGYGIDDAYTKVEIDNLQLITVADIDAICGATIQNTSISEVKF